MYSTPINFLATFVLSVFVLFGGALAASADSHEYMSSMSGTNDTGVVFLSGSEEVPAVSASTSGAARVIFNTDGTNMVAAVAVANGDEITAAHLHCGERGVNGLAVVTLFSDSAGRDVNGALTSKTVQSGDIADVNCASVIGSDIESLDDLAEAIREGDIYVNVHDEAHPNGVIRGQLSTRVSDSDDRDHRTMCDTKWNTWHAAHQYDGERWSNTEYEKECAQYSYDDGKNRGSGWSSGHEYSSDRHEDHDSTSTHTTWDTHDGHDWNNEWHESDGYNGRDEDDNYTHGYDSHDNNWRSDSDEEWNHDENDNDRDHGANRYERHDDYDRWHDDDDDHDRRGGVQLRASIGSIRSSLNL